MSEENTSTSQLNTLQGDSTDMVLNGSKKGSSKTRARKAQRTNRVKLKRPSPQSAGKEHEPIEEAKSRSDQKDIKLGEVQANESKNLSFDPEAYKKTSLFLSALGTIIEVVSDFCLGWAGMVSSAFWMVHVVIMSIWNAVQASCLTVYTTVQALCSTACTLALVICSRLCDYIASGVGLVTYAGLVYVIPELLMDKTGNALDLTAQIIYLLRSSIWNLLPVILAHLPICENPAFAYESLKEGILVYINLLLIVATDNLMCDLVVLRASAIILAHFRLVLWSVLQWEPYPVMEFLLAPGRLLIVLLTVYNFYNVLACDTGFVAWS